MRNYVVIKQRNGWQGNYVLIFSEKSGDVP